MRYGTEIAQDRTRQKAAAPKPPAGKARLEKTLPTHPGCGMQQSGVGEIKTSLGCNWDGGRVYQQFLLNNQHKQLPARDPAS